MSAVVFETPGLIDMRAFTIMGAHAKPNSTNPIGHFGTGMKYAIAGLVRMGCEPVVFIGRDKITFSKKLSKFRGSDLETITMSVLREGNKRPTNYELPFTIRYGINWKPWMLFRELESNTRDEAGKTYLLDTCTYGDNRLVRDRFSLEELVCGEAGKTKIIIDHPEFTAAANAIDEVFLPRAKRSGVLLEALPASEEGCQYLYYRTMRAKDLGKPSLFTYNILSEQSLTEDRQLAYEFMACNTLARWVLTEATESQVEKIITADEEWWEHDLEFQAHIQPSGAFRAVMARRPKGLTRYVSSYWSGHSGGYCRPPKRAFDLWQTCPKPWKLSGDYVFDANGIAVMERPDDMSADDWDEVASAIIGKMRANDTEDGRDDGVDVSVYADDDPPEPEAAEQLEPADTEPAMDDRIPF